VQGQGGGCGDCVRLHRHTLSKPGGNEYEALRSGIGDVLETRGPGANANGGGGGYGLQEFDMFPDDVAGGLLRTNTPPTCTLLLLLNASV